MILKEKDSQEHRIQQLERALKEAGSPAAKKKIEGDLAILRAGIKGEMEAAYLIDFDLKNNQNWMVIHDLRLERNGRTAQIDHLIINRLLEVYVVETKNIQSKVRFQNGGWERIHFNHWEGMPSPVEQNRRHIAVLKELIEAEKLAPERLGFCMPCDYYNVVAINPNCSVVGLFPKDVMVVKMDDLFKKIHDADPSMTAIFKAISQQTLEIFCRKLISYHKPSPMNDATAVVAAKTAGRRNVAGGKCEGCGGEVTPAEAYFCRLAKNKSRFAGKTLCRKCQSFAPAAVRLEVAGSQCDQCGTEVEIKVVNYCKANAKRFESKILCRACQTQ